MAAPSPDYSLYPREQLMAMLFAGDPAVVRRAADAWADTAGSLYSRQADMERQLQQFQGSWSGAVAERYQMMILNLIEGLRRTADACRLTADAVYSAAEELHSAQEVVRRGVRSTAALAYIVARLAARYRQLAAEAPPVPQTASPPAVAEVSSGAYFAQAGTQSLAPPLFAEFYRSGYASVREALGVRFPQAIPALAAAAPAPVVEQPVVEAPDIQAPVAEAPPAETTTASAPAVGRATVDMSSFGYAAPIVPAAPLTPVAFTEPKGPVAPPIPTGVGGLNVPPMIPPMIPPMMGGMGGMNELGGGRAAPNWLQEPKPDVVFGVPLQYTKWSVIGEPEDDPEAKNDSWSFE